MVWTHQYYYDDSGNYIGQAAPAVKHFTCVDPSDPLCA
jgi:YD repeat-containing protein